MPNTPLIIYTIIGICSCDATEHKLRPSNKFRALTMGGVSTIVMAKYVIKHIQNNINMST
jgi:hypothetical protein